MKTGTVRWFNALKGYGYIRPNDGGFDVFVSLGAVERAGMEALKEGQTINFETVTDERTGETIVENLSVADVEPIAPETAAGARASSGFRLRPGRSMT